jgi:Tfp pilus assembly protein PilV
VLSRSASANGFSVLELLLAATTLVVALTALAHLLVVASLVTRRARTLTTAAVLGQAKIEALAPHARTGVAASPSDTLLRNVDGYCDFVDEAGYVVGTGTAAPATAAYLRRWSIAQLPASPDTNVVQVLVTAPRRRDDPAGAPASLPGDARIVTLVRAAF